MSVLYKCLNELDRKVCHLDTDSIMYETPEGDEGLPNEDISDSQPMS